MLDVLAALFLLLAVLFLVLAVRAVRRRRFLRLSLSALTGLLMLSLAALALLLSLSTRGYRALTQEEVAAVIEVEPEGTQRFRARVRLASGGEHEFDLAGDELYVDAHILKWKALANLLGLHTAYELDRIGGRYIRLSDEERQPRTLRSLGEAKAINLFDLRRRSALLRPLVDVEYGSGTFILAREPAIFEVRVSTTGLLIREAPASGPEF